MNTRESGPRLIIICGLPCAGKTTLAKELEHRLRAVRFCPDEWMTEIGLSVWDSARRNKIENFQWKIGKQLLSLGLTIIIEWGTWTRYTRDVLRAAARALGAAVELHYLSAPVEVLFERIQRRGREQPPITLEQLQQWAQLFETPTPDEMAFYDNSESGKLLYEQGSPTTSEKP